MLPKKYRLEKHRIPEVARKGKRTYFKSFEMRFLKNEKMENPKICVIVSKKVSKKATERNRLKRKLRAWAWEQIKNGALPLGEYVLVGKGLT
ncbi:MAG: hypothetical protein Kow0081_3680 [Candidatus Dojkabacteria bacterium]